jgi:hypothetical protein
MAVKDSRFAPWAAASAGALGWALHHQLLGDVQHFRCGYSGVAFGIGVTLGVLVLIGLGSWLTLAAGDGGNPTRRFVVRFSLLLAALFLLPILLQAGATLLLPPCAR